MPEASQVNLGTAKVDLRLDLTDLDQHVEGYLEYNTALWDAATIARMAAHFRTLLDGIVANPDCTLSRLPLLDAGERVRLLEAGRGTLQRAGCVHEVFEQRAAQAPDGVTVDGEHGAQTAGEVNRRSNQLAHYLQRWGSKGARSSPSACSDRSKTDGVSRCAQGGRRLPAARPDYPRRRLEAGAPRRGPGDPRRRPRGRLRD